MNIETEKKILPPSCIRRWTHSSIYCYKRNCNCKGCIYEPIIKPCKMIISVLKLYAKFGKPTKKQMLDYYKNEKRYVNMIPTLAQIDTMRRCAKRELEKRQRFYPKWIAQGKMTQEHADFEIKSMQEIVDYFEYLQIHATPEQQSLFKGE